MKIYKVGLVRGKYINNFEGQAYDLIDKRKFSIVGISTIFPLNTEFHFPLKKLFSPADLENIGIPEPIIKWFFNRLIGDKQILFGLEQFKNDFDIFQTADYHYYYSFQLAQLRSKNKIKILLSTSWETIPFNNESIPKKRRIKRFTQKWVDHFLTYTKRAAMALKIEGVDPRKITTFPLGINLKIFKPSKIKKNNNLINILFVGRLVPEKGILDLIKAFLITKKYFGRKITIILNILGTGPLLSKIIKLTEENGLGNLVKMNFLPHKEIPSYYQKADILVFPSKATQTWEEQYGMVLVEGLACGLPIVAFNTGVIKEIVGTAGIVINPDIYQLAKKMILLTKNKNLRMLLSLKARQRALKYFDGKKTAKALERLYYFLLMKKENKS